VRTRQTSCWAVYSRVERGLSERVGAKVGKSLSCFLRHSTLPLRSWLDPLLQLVFEAMYHLVLALDDSLQSNHIQLEKIPHAEFLV